MHVSRGMCLAASYKLATELSVWGVHAVGNFISDNNDAKEKKSLIIKVNLCAIATIWWLSDISLYQRVLASKATTELIDASLIWRREFNVKEHNYNVNSGNMLI